MVGTFYLSVSFSEEKGLMDFLSQFPLDRRLLKLRVFFPLSSWRAIYYGEKTSLTSNGWWMEFEIPDEATTLISFLSELSMLEPIGYSITLSASFDNLQSFEKILQEFYTVEQIKRLERAIEEGF